MAEFLGSGAATITEIINKLASVYRAQLIHSHDYEIN